MCREAQLNLGYRWFCGLTLEDKVPDHSTFSKNRYGRFAQSDLFRDLFRSVVKQAQKHGFVKGRHLTVDATTVDADASLESLEEIVVPFDPEEYLDKVERENPVESQSANAKPKLNNETHVSRTDPDARLFRKKYERTRLAYSDSVLMDNASRVILDVEVTEPNLRQEGQVAGEMLQRSRFAYNISPESLGGDKAYGYGPAVRGVCEAGVKPHVGLAAQKGPHIEGKYRNEDFIYDKEKDELICPAGKRLWKRTTHKRNRQIEYVSSKADCKVCVRKNLCTRAPCRVVHRHSDKEFLDYAARLRDTIGYRMSQRCRKKVEMLFGEAKDFMGLRRARRRGYKNLMEQCLITATVQNIKRIIRAFKEPIPEIIRNRVDRTSSGFLARITNFIRKTLMHEKAHRIATAFF